jgi:hypothetical protein
MFFVHRLGVDFELCTKFTTGTWDRVNSVVSLTVTMFGYSGIYFILRVAHAS